MREGQLVKFTGKNMDKSWLSQIPLKLNQVYTIKDIVKGNFNGSWETCVVLKEDLKSETYQNMGWRIDIFELVKIPSNLSKPASKLSSLSLERLNELMLESVETEDYDKAILYRDEINRRNLV